MVVDERCSLQGARLALQRESVLVFCRLRIRNFALSHGFHPILSKVQKYELLMTNDHTCIPPGTCYY